MKQDYPAAFEECWKEYPKRQPDNPKVLAYKAWMARVNQNVPIADLLQATKSYAEFCRSTRKWGTELVMYAATFYGPHERYVEYLPKPEIVSERPVAPKKPIYSEPRMRHASLSRFWLLRS